MGTAHGRADHLHLHVHGTTPVHRLPASAKILGLVVFAVAMALTPRRAVAAFVVDGAALIAVAGIAGLGFRLVITRVAVIVPFVAAAAIVPFVAEGGPHTDIAGLSVSTDGLWATWNIVAKATLGATASIIVSATTPIPDLLAGLTRLRVPAVLVAIIAFMIRYLDLLVDDLQRMRNAMVARGHDPRWLWQVRPVAASAGALFVRSYERGERVHGAMSARGYTGTMPTFTEPDVTRRHFAVALAPGLVATVALVASVVAR